VIRNQTSIRYRSIVYLHNLAALDCTLCIICVLHIGYVRCILTNMIILLSQAINRLMCVADRIKSKITSIVLIVSIMNCVGLSGWLFIVRAAIIGLCVLSSGTQELLFDPNLLWYCFYRHSVLAFACVL
jgi:hypothetical protein